MGSCSKELIILILSIQEVPDILLEDYDTIFVPSIFQQRPVRVIGAVIAPGAYPITEPKVRATQVFETCRWFENRFRGFAQIGNPHK